MDEHKIDVVHSGYCQFSGFKEHVNKGIENILQKLTESNTENRIFKSVSYELTIKVE